MRVDRCTTAQLPAHAAEKRSSRRGNHEELPLRASHCITRPALKSSQNPRSLAPRRPAVYCIKTSLPRGGQAGRGTAILKPLSPPRPMRPTSGPIGPGYHYWIATSPSWAGKASRVRGPEDKANDWSRIPPSFLLACGVRSSARARYRVPSGTLGQTKGGT
jgi:hypothetical protein